ncbi:MAG: hypothetical protein JWP75_2780 [Frondihabitans sp.]|nr:hypothetical protein [Frondihabitans sp.]
MTSLTIRVTGHGIVRTDSPLSVVVRDGRVNGQGIVGHEGRPATTRQTADLAAGHAIPRRTSPAAAVLGRRSGRVGGHAALR